MSDQSSQPTSTADREIVISRLFDAPRELVFKAWTDRESLAQWWGPRGFSTTTHEMDVRPGGVWRFVMHGPNGVDYENKIVFVDVVETEKLVSIHSSGEEGDAGFEVTVTFADEDGKTRLTLQQLYATAAERDFSAREYHAVEMGNQTLDRLAEYLATR